MTVEEKRRLIVDIAMHFLGRFYIWGGDDPSGFDCSGFVIEVYKSVGLLPRQGDWTAEILSSKFTKVPRFEVKAGDLVFWKNQARIVHVEICLNDFLSIGASGGGSATRTVEDAIRQNAFIKIRPMDSRPNIWGFESPY